MGLDLGSLKLPSSAPNYTALTLDGWRKGVITLIDKSRVPKDALIEAQNLFLTEDGIPTVRPGVDYYGTAPSASAIDGAAMYYTAAGAPILVVVAGGTVYYSTNDGATWTACTGATLTSGQKCWFIQDHGYLYITNKYDNITRFDGTSVLQTYTVLSTPTAPVVVETGTGLTSGTSYHHYYKISAVNSVGFTVASANSTVIDTGIDRSNWSYTTPNYATVSWAAVTGATRYDVYYSNDNIDYFYLDTVVGNASVNYVDDGTALINTNVLAPTDNTTQGPKVQRLEAIGSRLWGVDDKDNAWRVWFSGSGPYAGYFSSAYDGGYIDLMKGSQYRPVRVVDYRDGKGTPYATVWMKSPDGLGCLWQLTLEVITIGTESITVPNAYRLPGSRGTDAPESVVNVLNDYHFFNSQAFYNLGSRPQYLNLLSTDEFSANIRPSVKQISATAAPGICSIYSDAKVYWSVPVGSTSNNVTMVYDTERKAWLPEAFLIGFERFLQYVDTAGTRKLLAWKTGDTKLSQISDSIRGDYGVAFNTSLVTGLYPTSRDRFEFMFVEEAEFEFSQPSGDINVELIGIERSQGYSSQKTVTLTSTTSTTGWSSFLWSTKSWSDTSDAVDTFSESSVKRYFTVQRELNAYQWRVTTTSLDADYLLRTLQIKGTATDGGKPRSWRLTT
jgi:hypothetical protein